MVKYIYWNSYHSIQSSWRAQRAKQWTYFVRFKVMKTATTMLGRWKHYTFFQSRLLFPIFLCLELTKTVDRYNIFPFETLHKIPFGIFLMVKECSSKLFKDKERKSKQIITETGETHLFHSLHLFRSYNYPILVVLIRKTVFLRRRVAKIVQYPSG